MTNLFHPFFFIIPCSMSWKNLISCANAMIQKQNQISGWSTFFIYLFESLCSKCRKQFVAKEVKEIVLKDRYYTYDHLVIPV